MSPEILIERLQLNPLPLEGGWYRETYRAPLQLPADVIGPSYPTSRPAGTAIYYLLTPETFSALHRLPGDEVFHFYLGDAVEMLQLDPDGQGGIVILGPDLLNGESLQTVVPGRVWQGSRLREGGRFALMGTTMAPGFDFADYQPGNPADLTARYPAYEEWIARLTR
jgi:predicted cupin superfamily sugar epimerase